MPKVISEELMRVLRDAGTQSKLAAFFGVSRSAVAQWVRRGGLPAARAVELEERSYGQYIASELVVQGTWKQQAQANKGEENDA